MGNRQLHIGVVGQKGKNLASSRDRNMYYLSCGVLCRNVAKIIEEKFKPDYFFLNYCDNSARQEKAFNKFIASCDIVLELPLKQVFEVKDKTIPIVFFAFGFMSNPFRFFAEFSKRLWTNNSILFSCQADFEIFNNLFGGNINGMGYLLPWPLETNEFKPQAKSENKRIREKFAIPVNSPLVLYSGRISLHKNIHTLLKIFKEVVKEFPQARLCMAGKEDSVAFREINTPKNGYASFLKKKCSEYGISNKVVMTGKLERKELISLYSSADVLLNCTINPFENFGYAQVEAMACGIPVICSNWGGLKDTVIEGKTGYHIPTILTNNGIKVDWQKGVSAIIGLLKDKNKLTRMSKECIQHVKTNFSFDRFANSLESIFIDTIKRKNKKIPIQNLVKIKDQDKQFMNLFMEYLSQKIKKNRENKGFVEQAFLNRHYDYYKFFISPYSSVSASEIFRRDTLRVPYFLQDVEFFSKPPRISINDPIWPKNYRLKKWKFETLSIIVAGKSIRDIYFNLKQENLQIDMVTLMRFCKYLTDEGVLSFL